jgi:hypothetical protein
MHARQSVTSTRDTEPAGNSEKSRTSRACFAFAPFDAPAFFVDLDATDFFDDFDAASFLVEEVFDAFGDAGLFDGFLAADFLPAAPFFTFDAAAFAPAFAVGFAFFAAVFRVLLVAAIKDLKFETHVYFSSA